MAYTWVPATQKVKRALDESEALERSAHHLFPQKQHCS
jgi:hypothetical protein